MIKRIENGRAVLFKFHSFDHFPLLLWRWWWWWWWWVIARALTEKKKTINATYTPLPAHCSVRGIIWIGLLTRKKKNEKIIPHLLLLQWCCQNNNKEEEEEEANATPAVPVVVAVIFFVFNLSTKKKNATDGTHKGTRWRVLVSGRLIGSDGAHAQVVVFFVCVWWWEEEEEEEEEEGHYFNYILSRHLSLVSRRL